MAVARSPVAMVRVCRASNPGISPCSLVGHTERLTVETTRSPAAVTTASRADSAPARASVSVRARWTAESRTRAVSGTAAAEPVPVTVRVRTPRTLAAARQTVMFSAAKISSVALDRFSV